jgi:hypothetical protein
MEPEARKRLDEFRKKGVKIFNSENIDLIPPTVEVTPATWKLQVTCRDFGDGVLGYYIINTTDTTVSARLSVPETRAAAVSDSTCGKFYPVESENGSWDWTFGPFESRWFFFGLPAEKLSPMPPCPGKVLKSLDSWKLQPTLLYTHDVHEITTSVPEAAPKAVKLGDWRPVLGEKFTGEAVYSTRFTVKPEELDQIRFLDLGVVKYAAEVKLNGQVIGSTMMAPFRFPVQGALRKGSNTLEITVTNTLANALSPQEVQDHWAKVRKVPSAYNTIQLSFESEALPSGLFGPVRLMK